MHTHKLTVNVLEPGPVNIRISVYCPTKIFQIRLISKEISAEHEHMSIHPTPPRAMWSKSDYLPIHPVYYIDQSFFPGSWRGRSLGTSGASV